MRRPLRDTFAEDEGAAGRFSAARGMREQRNEMKWDSEGERSDQTLAGAVVSLSASQLVHHFGPQWKKEGIQ